MNLEHFRTYIKDVRGVSDKSMNHYIGALTTINTLLEKYNFPIQNIFSITELSELDQVQAFLDNNEEFQKRNSTGHNMYSVAFKHYCRFLLWYKQ